tara:strand:+ start:92 stop:487 length:396 start_codon:yes stop_codon:yes gene_type:complete
MTIFDWVNQIFVYKKPWDSFTEEEQKKFSPFIINRFLSMDKELIEIVNMFQPYAIGTLESKDVYEFYRNLFPKGKRYNKYIKGKRNKKYDKELLELVSKHFEVSKNESKSYIDLLSRKDIKELYKKYGVKK